MRLTKLELMELVLTLGGSYHERYEEYPKQEKELDEINEEYSSRYEVTAHDLELEKENTEKLIGKLIEMIKEWE